MSQLCNHFNLLSDAIPCCVPRLCELMSHHILEIGIKQRKQADTLNQVSIAVYSSTYPCDSPSIACTNMSWTFAARRPNDGSSHSVNKYQ